MKNLFNYISAGLVAIAMVAGSADLNAQTRAARSSSSTSSSQQRSTSSSSTRSSSASRSSSSASANRSSSASSSRNNSAATPQVSRNNSSSSQQRSSATSSTRSSSSSTKSTAATPQVNRNSRTEATQSNNSATARQNNSAAAARQNSSSTASRQNSNTQQVARQSAASNNDTKATQSSAAAARSSAAKGLNNVGSSSRTSVSRENINMSAQNLSNMKMDDKRNISRVAPVQRDRIQYNTPDHFFNPGNHYFGYGVHHLPPHYSHMHHWGVDYYYHNDIYYRRHGTIYVVCRPPFGVTFSRSLRRMQFATVRFAYYYNVYRTFNVIDDNYRTIMEQNRVIAANNARIAQQNASIALNADRAYSAHNIANALGLVQSYAGLDSEYFYEDGVFYAINKRGRYEVIVPPAGALVDELPDDYDIIVLNGIEYYRVDDTVYRLTLVDGTPLLEVLGQMPYQMASRYWN